MSYAICCYLLEHFAVGFSNKQKLYDAINSIQKNIVKMEYPYPGFDKKNGYYIASTPDGIAYDSSWVIADREKKERPKELQTRLFIK
jgi:hypothetical protein